MLHQLTFLTYVIKNTSKKQGNFNFLSIYNVQSVYSKAEVLEALHFTENAHFQGLQQPF